MLSRSGINLNVLEFDHLPIFEQLRIEEALLRAGEGNWCIINRGSDLAVVMGVSATPHEVVEIDRAKKMGATIIRRFSGGGTVVVDKETCFFTIILDEKELSYPNVHDTMLWMHELLSPVFVPHLLTLEEQDFAIDDLKIAGNAQCFASKRVLHHTSFLWSWQEEQMSLLSIPKRQPAYRRERSHAHFCNCLSSYFASKEHFVEALKKRLGHLFQICPVKGIGNILSKPHRKALKQL
jgi:lipoate-protein ligase A